MDNPNLKKAGLKVTLPRVKILELLKNARNQHLSAEDIYKILIETGEDVGLATIYRVLTQFEEAKLVVRHNFSEGHSVFELDSGTHHDHLVCIQCGSVKEFMDNIVEKRLQQVAEETKFNITEHSLNIYGVCEECQLK